MKKLNLKAGFIADSIAHLIKKQETEKPSAVEGLLNHLSTFDAQFPSIKDLDFSSIHPILAVINNIITRGLPTRCPVSLEELFVKTGLTQPNKEEYEFKFINPTKTINFKTIFELLHLVEPDLNISKNRYAGDLGSDLERKFLFETLSDYPFVKQIFQPQRDFATINPEMAGERTVDFAFTSPYETTGDIAGEHKPFQFTKGFIIEVDGPHHKAFDYKIYDQYRDDAAEDVDYKTLRITDVECKENEKLTNIKSLLEKPFFKIYADNFNRKHEDFLEEYALIFIPLAVARIMKTLIEVLLRYPKLLEEKKIKIAIIERDFPCGAVGVKLFEDFFKNINNLLEKDDKHPFPNINLTIYNNDKWGVSEHFQLSATVADKEHFEQFKESFDVILDHSILRRSGIYNENNFIAKNAIKIRSAHFVDNTFGNARRTYCASLLKYRKLVKKQDNGDFSIIKKTEPSITYFLQNIFRKKSFRDGQLPIISRALQSKPVIGLMPTGGGKSLTFQLSAFLQPGICLVVDPIKSLMEDQVRVLKENWIDCCDYINSNIGRKEKAQRLIDFKYGETMFFFFSPERFIMEDFRKIVKNIDASPFGLAFSFCVIDEVHCVSEWGHDFRTTYLMLGKNAQKYARAKDGKPASLIGLTATASFDVLADVERELHIQSKDAVNAIIAIENTIRPELFFRVIDVTGNPDRVAVLNEDFSQLGQNLSKINTRDVLEKSQKHHFDEFEKKDFSTKESLQLGKEEELEFEYKDKYLLHENGVPIAEMETDEFSTISFCLTKSNTRGGVHEVFENLGTTSRGFFHGTDENDNQAVDEVIQNHFTDFVNGNIQHMVCTKAFGMGIDKANVRSTYHIKYPSSLESFVQEAGRAGRDRKVSESVILVSKEDFFYLSHLCLRSKDGVNPVPNVRNRKKIRDRLLYRWVSEDDKWKFTRWEFPSQIDLEIEIEDTVNDIGAIPPHEKTNLITHLKRFIQCEKIDRGSHNFFQKNSFKGIDSEKSQLYSLFKYKEFLFKNKNIEFLESKLSENYNGEFSISKWKGFGLRRLYLDKGTSRIGFLNFTPTDIVINPIGNPFLTTLKDLIIASGNDGFDNFIKAEPLDIENQGTLIEVFNASENTHFDFILAPTKIYNNSIEETCKLLGIKPEEQISPPEFTKTYEEQILSAAKKSKDFEDYFLMLEEIGNKITLQKLNDTKRWLWYYYNRDRESSTQTGKLIYRMTCMGFLEDYTIDYKMNKIHHCVFRKHDTIEPYLDNIESYLRRYESEKSAIAKKEKLKSRLVHEKLIDNILECLYFLTEFSYKEIAEKRKRATNEIQDILIKSISDAKYTGDWFEQNKFLREEIYFYFNAKYATKDIKINGEPYSLLEDYKSSKDSDLAVRIEYLTKYLEIVKEGTAQNNYKHMIGSCKKILRSLTVTEFEKDWLLHLLKAFSMYATNNTTPSYISEANDELDLGFKKLYHLAEEQNFDVIEPIFTKYFEQLRENLKPDSLASKNIKIVRLNLLLNFQKDKLSTILNSIKF